MTDLSLGIIPPGMYPCVFFACHAVAPSRVNHVFLAVAGNLLDLAVEADITETFCSQLLLPPTSHQ